MIILQFYLYLFLKFVTIKFVDKEKVMFLTKAIPVLIVAFCSFALAMPTTVPKLKSAACQSWVTSTSNDIAKDDECLNSFLREFSKSKKKFGHVKQQRYDLPVISSFPVQRILA